MGETWVGDCPQELIFKVNAEYLSDTETENLNFVTTSVCQLEKQALLLVTTLELPQRTELTPRSIRQIQKLWQNMKHLQVVHQQISM